jgi:hypothetical protein
MYVAALYRCEPEGEADLGRQTAGSGYTPSSLGTEMIGLSSVQGLDGAVPHPKATFLLDRKLSDSGAWSDYGPGFRWGGTIARGADGKLQAVGVSRLLTYGPAQRYAKTRIWSQ